MGTKIRALLISEQELKNRVSELERREAAYLEMLTQADDMWAEMEGGYKKRIQESQTLETTLKNRVRWFSYSLIRSVVIKYLHRFCVLCNFYVF